MLYAPFQKDVASLKSLPCNGFLDLERPERLFGHSVWFPVSTHNNMFSLTDMIFTSQSPEGHPSATEARAGLSFCRPGLLGVCLPMTEQVPCVQTLVLLRAGFQKQSAAGAAVCLERPMTVFLTDNKL